MRWTPRRHKFLTMTGNHDPKTGLTNSQVFDLLVKEHLITMDGIDYVLTFRGRAHLNRWNRDHPTPPEESTP